MQIEVPVPFSAYRDSQRGEQFLKILDKYKRNIASVYLPIGYISKEICSFGIRNAHVEGKITAECVEKFHNILFNRTDIPVKILCNDLYSGHLHHDFNNLLDKIYLYKKKCHVKSIVVADFFLGKLLSNEDIPICLSVNSTTGISSLSHAMLHDKKKKIAGIVFPRELNRSINTINDFIKNHHACMIGVESVLMVNEGCAPFCPYKQAGDIEIMIDNSIKHQCVNIHTRGCTAIRKDHPWLFLASPFLSYSMLQRPEYKSFTIKIAGRNLEPRAIDQILDHYINGTSLKLSELNNIQQLPEINTAQLTQKFEDTVLSCDKQCINCFKCRTYYNEFIGSDSTS